MKYMEVSIRRGKQEPIISNFLFEFGNFIFEFEDLNIVPLVADMADRRPVGS
jgi:hypothetical protein